MAGKIHLVGMLKPKCGKWLDEVEYVYKIKDGATCKTCIKNAENFQKDPSSLTHKEKEK